MKRVIGYYYGLPILYLLQSAMILNKVTFAPFSLSLSKQQSHTPRLFTQNKKLHRKVNQMQSLQPSEKQPFKFDDNFCFTELHKNAQTTKKKQKQFKTKKCISQFLSIKHINQNPSQRNEIQQNIPLEDPTFRAADHKAFELFNEGKWYRDQIENKFYQSGLSSRCKYSMNKTCQDLSKCIPQRPLTQQKYTRKKSSSIKNKFTFNMEQFTRSVKSSTFKCVELGTAPILVEKEDEMKSKKSNFFQYSIIRPDEIKPFALKKRENDRSNYVNRKKEYRMIYEQMLQQMRRKEEINKRNAAVKQQRAKEQSQCFDIRINVPTNSKRKPLYVCVDQKNEVKPWQVQAISPLISEF